MNTFTFCSFLLSPKPLVGKILEGLENTQCTPWIFNQLFPIFITVYFAFFFWHSTLILYNMAQHTSYEHQLSLLMGIS